MPDWCSSGFRLERYALLFFGSAIGIERFATLDHVLGDHVAATGPLIGQVVHDVQHHFFDDRSQAAGTGLLGLSLAGDGLQSLFSEL